MRKSTSTLIILSILLFSGCKKSTSDLAYSNLGVRVDSLLQAAVENGEIPGGVAYVKLGEALVYHKAFGWRNIEDEVLLHESDIFRMASMTKGLTAVAVLQLVEQGKLGLDDNLSQYIPEFKNPQILIDVLADSSFTSEPAKNEITIRQLLTHTSGIGYGFQDEKYNALIIKNNISEGFEDDSRTSLGNIQQLAKIPLLCEPGEKFIYSMSYDVLGVVIEVVSGLRYDKYITENILQPLGMSYSYFIVPETERVRLVTVYQPTNDNKGVEPTDSGYKISCC